MMKKLAVVLLLLSNFQLFSQKYLPVIEDDKQWHLLTTLCDISGGVAIDLGADTVLSAERYRSVFLTNCGERELIGFLRSDTTNSKLWFLVRDDEEEKLIMDLDLEPGDTFAFGGYYGAPERMLVVGAEAQHGRKTITLSSAIVECILGTDRPIQMIEGLGPNFGFTYGSPIDQANHSLLVCARQSGEAVYVDPEFDPSYCGLDCIILAAGETNGAKRKIDVWPNPVREMLYIKPQSAEQHDYRLFDTAGKLILSGEIESGAGEVDVRRLASGIYYLVIAGHDRVTHRQKIVKL